MACKDIAPAIIGCVRRMYCLLHEAKAVVVHVCVVCCCSVQLFQKIDFGTYFVYHNELLVVSATIFTLPLFFSDIRAALL